MRRRSSFVPGLLLLGLIVPLGGCQRAAEAEAEAVAAAKAAEDAPNPPAVSVAQGIAAIDLRTFPVMEGAVYVERTPSHVSFSVPKGVVKEAVDFCRTKLGEMDWKQAADPRLTQVVGEGAQVFFEKDGQRLYVAIGVSPADKNLNFALFHLGNIDARKLPHLGGLEFADSLPSRTIASAGTAKPEDLQKELRKAFVDQGWREYVEPRRKGTPRFEREDRSLKFLQNGVGVDISIMPFEGKTNIYTSVRLLDVQWPIDIRATHLEFQPDPIYLFYMTKTELPEVLDLNRRELVPAGWKQVEGKGKTADDGVVMKLEKPDHDPLRLEVLRRNEMTLVMIRTWSRDDDR